MMYSIRFLIAFSVMSVLVAIGVGLGGKPSSWTVAVLLSFSALLAYITKPEALK